MGKYRYMSNYKINKIYKSFVGNFNAAGNFHYSDVSRMIRFLHKSSRLPIDTLNPLDITHILDQKETAMEPITLYVACCTTCVYGFTVI